jgi:hypothetical protein
MMADARAGEDDDVWVTGTPGEELPFRLRRARKLRVQWRDQVIGMLVSTEEWQRLTTTLEAYEAQIAELIGERAIPDEIPAWRPRIVP